VVACWHVGGPGPPLRSLALRGGEVVVHLAGDVTLEDEHDLGFGAPALLNVATDRLRELGHVEAGLWVVPDNQRARRLHESEGWGDDDLRRDDEVFGVVVSQMRYRRLLVEPSGQPDPTSE